MDTVENGYQVRASTNVSIDGGILSNVGTYGVFIYSDAATATTDTSVKNLSIGGTPTHGIRAQVISTGSHTNLSVEGCKISGSTTFALDFSTVTGLFINNNRCTYSTGDGVKTDICTDAIVRNTISEKTGGASTSVGFQYTNGTNITTDRNTALGVATGIKFQTNTKVVWNGGDNLDEAATPVSDLGSNTSYYGTFSGTFTAANAASTNINDKRVETYSRIFITPSNAAAGTLQAGADAVYEDLSNRVVNTSFRVTTAGGGNAAGTETFSYVIRNQNM